MDPTSILRNAFCKRVQGGLVACLLIGCLHIQIGRDFAEEYSIHVTGGLPVSI